MNTKGLIPGLAATLDLHSLPSISVLLDNPVKPASWKRSIKKQLGVRAYLEFLEHCQGYFVSECDVKIGRPLPHWSVMIGDVHRTHANNFMIRLLTGCDGLEKDTARLRSTLLVIRHVSCVVTLLRMLPISSPAPGLSKMKESALLAPSQLLSKCYCQIMRRDLGNFLTSS